ncbi:MAG: glycosyltransferase family 2 protein [Hyphomicrobiaceae bacterium]|nr:glycosyltransferase family 2 protein [Hyphomicrobiaceae bacterium]
MSVIIIISLNLLALLLILPVGFFIIELLVSLRPPKADDFPDDLHPRTTILVPAHDESQQIGAVLEKLQSGLPQNCALLVVADNCSDDTAEIAKNAGAEVIIRREESKRGKGFALDFGVSHLRSDPPDVVIIVDADCLVEKGSIERLAAMAQHTGRPVQSNYLMEPHADGDLAQQISAFAFMINTYHRMLGVARMGIPARLNGTGMAFPWKVISQVDLGNDNIVEDIKLGVDLVKAGTPALFCPHALVTSQFPQSDEALKIQRTRWEHGHLELVRTVAPGLLWHSLAKRNWSALGFALDLAIPPLTLALLGLIAGFMVSALAALAGFSTLPLVLFTITGFFFTASIGLVWGRDGQKVLPPAALKNLPGYVLSKIRIYSGYIFSREKSWIRTDRN